MPTILGLLRVAYLRLRRPSALAALQPGRLAFASVSTDPSLLGRLPPGQARRIAGLAEAFAASLLRDSARGHAGSAAREAAVPVLRSIRQFSARDNLLGDSVDDMIASARAAAPDGLGGLLATLAYEAPGATDPACTLSMEAVLALGRIGLQRLDRADAETLMAAASRHAAHCMRNGSRSSEVIETLRTVEISCAGLGVLPLAPTVRGQKSEWADALVELWRDACTCAERPGSGPARKLWEDARDAHAFGAVWGRPSILSVLVRAEADALARDARAAGMFVMSCRSTGPGVNAAIEAARTVLVACGSGRGDDVVVPVRRSDAVRPAAEQVRASHA